MQRGRVRTVALAAGLVCGAASATGAPRPALPLLKLEILTRSLPASHRAPPAGATLVGNSLSENRRQRLATALRALLAAQAKRQNPFYVSLDEGAERTLVQELLADTGPMFTAAAALAAGRWQSAEGDLVLRPAVRCGARARCVAVLGGQPKDDLDKRARFLAWPLGYAILLRLGSSAEAVQMADRLRDRPEEATQVALVLTGSELHRVRPSPALREVTTLALALVSKQAHLPFADRLRDLAAVASAANELPWLKLAKNTLLIVPRLGSLATVDGFVAEVRACVGDAQVEWLATPR